MANWSREECILLVQSYFEMFELQRGELEFSKAEKRRELCTKISRSEGSIEFKHMNVSAVLDDLNLEWLQGYRPDSGRNYQKLLKEVVVEFLESEKGRHLKIVNQEKTLSDIKYEGAKRAEEEPQPGETAGSRGDMGEVVAIFARASSRARKIANRAIYILGRIDADGDWELGCRESSKGKVPAYAFSSTKAKELSNRAMDFLHPAEYEAFFDSIEIDYPREEQTDAPEVETKGIPLKKNRREPKRTSVSQMMEQPSHKGQQSNDEKTENEKQQDPVLKSKGEMKMDISTPDLSETEESSMEESKVEKQPFYFKSLDELRTKLFDLTRRNRLLNFKQTRSKAISIIDELPNQVAELLYSGKSFSIEPVPDFTEKQLIEAGYLRKTETGEIERLKENPSAKEWAKVLGLATERELPTPLSAGSAAPEKHQDTALQVLHFPIEMEARLNLLRRQSESALAEKGVNILFLILGFIEWYEDKESDVPNDAPLFVMPVTVKKQRGNEGKVVYHLSRVDLPLVTNKTLAKRLLQDFQLVLPEVIDGETLPETYFRAIEEKIIKHKSRWRLKRWGTIGLLDFLRQALYEDLARESWPDEKQFEQHPVIRQFFTTSEESADESGIGFPTEHQIDRIPSLHERYGLIYSADSSQHSAIIDAMEGKNLVIEGPPGTGKSQTISNLIATAIANGKSVLFVAEKMAALDVVKARLDQRGLGDFCLELHSAKTRKKNVLDSLIARYKAQDTFEKPRKFNSQVKKLNEKRDHLNEYAVEVNKEWRKTGWTVHQIFSSATRYANELTEHEATDFIPESSKHFDASTHALETLSKEVSLLEQAIENGRKQSSTGELSDHPWFGTVASDIDESGARGLLREMAHLMEQYKTVEENVSTLATALGMSSMSTVSVSQLSSLTSTVKSFPKGDCGEFFGTWQWILEEPKAFKKFLEAYVTFHDSYQNALQTLKPIIFEQTSQQMMLKDWLSSMLKVVQPSESLTSLAVFQVELTALIPNLKGLIDRFAELRAHQDLNVLHPLFNLHLDALADYLRLAELLQKRPNIFPKEHHFLETDDAGDCLAQYESVVKELRDWNRAIESFAQPSALESSRILSNAFNTWSEGGFFKWFSAPWREANKFLKSQLLPHSSNEKKRSDMYEGLIEYAKAREAVENFSKGTSFAKQNLQFEETPVEGFRELHQWIHEVRKEFGSGFGTRPKIGDFLIELNASQYPKLHKVIADKNLIRAVQEVESKTRILLPGVSNKITQDITFETHPLVQLKGFLDAPFNAVVATVQRQDSNLEECSKALRYASKAIAEGEKLSHKISQSDYIPRSLQFGTGVGELKPAEVESARWALDTATKFRAAKLPPSWLAEIRDRQSFLEMKKQVQSLTMSLERLGQLEDDVIERGRFMPSLWRSNDRTPAVMADKIERAAQLPEGLKAMQSINKRFLGLDDSGFSAVTREFRLGKLEADQMMAAVQAGVFKKLGDEIRKKNAHFKRFDALSHQAVRDEFAQCDEELLEMQCQQIAHKASKRKVPKGIASGLKSDLTELALIEHESGKKSRHIPIRKLLLRAPRATLALKPCFMMSPLSVAQYLEPGHIEFDMVIMDEASQIRPESALGAIARGKQVIVVGDEKQLPPTSFFERMTSYEDDEEDQEVAAIQEAESIISAVRPIFTTRTLKWHYRSRHDSLIAFSNQFFYDSKLVLFPSSISTSDEYGIKWHPIEDGVFKNRRNIKEAREIVQLIEKHLRENAHESLGVVAMSADQRTAIEDQLEAQTREDPVFAALVEANSVKADPLFIKNLENVQGDERDVIIISFTYGPQKPGDAVPQRFGPINSFGGWRRLNVLFTRSKKRMIAVSSMTFGDIRVSESSARGPKALHNFLKFAETGNLSGVEFTGREPDSDFEVAVMSRLEKAGFETVPQVGVSGYRIDLAVRDPGKPGEFLMGIECDGATYHSAKSARDRDKLRQEVLEGLGWRIRRIWSTDWFLQPETTIQPIIDELNQLKSIPQVVESGPEDKPEETNVELSPSLLPGVEVSSTSPIVEVEETITAETEAKYEPVTQQVPQTLRERLEQFNRDFILPRTKNTPPEKQILREEMLEQFLEHEPCTKTEFQTHIPMYLRGSIIARDAKRFLDDILDIISEEKEDD